MMASGRKDHHRSSDWNQTGRPIPYFFWGTLCWAQALDPISMKLGTLKKWYVLSLQEQNTSTWYVWVGIWTPWAKSSVQERRRSQTLAAEAEHKLLEPRLSKLFKKR